jgi:hypothetical protein
MKPLAAIVLLGAIGLAQDAAAQQVPIDDPSPPAKASVLFVPGIVFTAGLFGDDSPKGTDRLGPSLGTRLCIGGRGAAFIGDLNFLPLPLTNPHFDEKLRPAFVDAGVRIGRGTCFRIGAGLTLQFWSGKSAASKLDYGLTLMVAAGREGFGGWKRVAPELVVRASAARGIALLSLGAQAAIGTCGQK